MTREVVVQSVGFSEDGIELGWMVLPDDVRSGATIVSSRSTAIAYKAPEGLGELATDLRTAVTTLGERLREELEAGRLPVYEPPAAETLGYERPAVDNRVNDDDDDVGMGDGR